MGKAYVPGNVVVLFEGETGDVSDSYHTFNELYAHRCSLFVALILASEKPSWRSWKDDLGKSMGDWFLAGMELTEGVTITYHLPDHMWVWLDGTHVETLDKGPEWDGHTSEDVIHRLAAWCKELGGKCSGVEDESKDEE